MQLPDESVEDFRALYVKEFGKPLSVDDARAMIARLVTLYEVLLRPILPDGDIPLQPGDNALRDAADVTSFF